MPNDTDRGWTLHAYIEHNESRWESDARFQAERDRRYAEVKSAEEKALRVKDEADKSALGLAREIQAYKDEKANELRSQIERERGDYATQSDLKSLTEKMDAALLPIRDHMATQSGTGKGMRDLWAWIIAAALAGAEIYRVFGH